ncbi:MAG: nucleotidyltransferase family protein [Magnetococcales bacterium]|nr:nucleotidyltransferase family protein [Magnetococcales bacterium]
MNAMILAAGKGERLQPLTNHIPKPMVEVGEKSIIQHTLEGVAALGINRVVINAWHLADKLIRHVGTGGQWGVEVAWSREDRLLNTGGGVRNALAQLGEETTLLVNGDILWDLDLQPLLDGFDKGKMDGLLGLIANPPYKKSDFFCPAQGGELIRAHGKEGGYTYAGIMVFRPGALADYPLEPFSLNHFFDDAMASGRLFGQPLSGRWADMGTPQRLAQVQKEWHNDSLSSL